jgi:hypothetical protein
MGLEPILGRALHEAVVTDSSILGGQTMRVYEARWQHLGSGEEPWTKHGTLYDTLDVADLESETEHAYELLGAREGEQIATEGNAPDGTVVLDGGRTQRVRERFTIHVPAGKAIRAIARVETSVRAVLRVHSGSGEARVPVEGPLWTEVAIDLPARAGDAREAIEVDAEGAAFTSFHWWFTDAGE